MVVGQPQLCTNGSFIIEEKTTTEETKEELYYSVYIKMLSKLQKRKEIRDMNYYKEPFYCCDASNY